jgi:hypothetical protein
MFVRVVLSLGERVVGWSWSSVKLNEACARPTGGGELHWSGELLAEVDRPRIGLSMWSETSCPGGSDETRTCVSCRRFDVASRLCSSSR